MGDRCMMSIRIHKDDITTAAKILTEDGWFLTVETGETSLSGYCQHGYHEIDEVNYGGDSIREDLAKAGVRYVGSHSEGGSYCGGQFYHNGSGVDTHAPVTNDGELFVALTVTFDGRLAPDPKRIEALQQFYHNEASTRKLIEESWK